MHALQVLSCVFHVSRHTYPGGNVPTPDALDGAGVNSEHLELELEVSQPRCCLAFSTVLM